MILTIDLLIIKSKTVMEINSSVQRSLDQVTKTIEVSKLGITIKISDPGTLINPSDLRDLMVDNRIEMASAIRTPMEIGSTIQTKARTNQISETIRKHASGVL